MPRWKGSARRSFFCGRSAEIGGLASWRCDYDCSWCDARLQWSLRPQLSVDRYSHARTSLDPELPASKLAQRLVARAVFQRARNIAPAELDDAAPFDGLHDYLSAIDVRAFDQLDTAMVAAIGDSCFGRPEVMAPFAIINDQLKRLEVCG